MLAEIRSGGLFSKPSGVKVALLVGESFERAFCLLSERLSIREGVDISLFLC